MANFIIVDNHTIMINQETTPKNKLINEFKKLFDDDI